ncbi:MAG TPA: hypothetical protein PKA64_26775 [Myxococcota bacterium]|nr:hypothetical protein [Myxococcota bacterium]
MHHDDLTPDRLLKIEPAAFQRLALGVRVVPVDRGPDVHRPRVPADRQPEVAAGAPRRSC